MLLTCYKKIYRGSTEESMETLEQISSAKLFSRKYFSIFFKCSHTLTKMYKINITGQIPAQDLANYNSLYFFLIYFNSHT